MTRRSPLLDTRVIYSGDCLDRLGCCSGKRRTRTTTGGVDTARMMTNVGELRARRSWLAPEPAVESDNAAAEKQRESDDNRQRVDDSAAGHRDRRRRSPPARGRDMVHLDLMD
jgi:hypothetical protein